MQFIYAVWMETNSRTYYVLRTSGINEVMNFYCASVQFIDKLLVLYTLYPDKLNVIIITNKALNYCQVKNFDPSNTSAAS